MSPRLADAAYTVGLRCAGLVVLTALALMLVLLAVWALPATYQLPRGVLSMFGGVWQPSDGAFGVMPLLAATMLVAAGAVTLAAPVGVAAAAFIDGLGPAPLRPPLSALLWMMAGVPSVVWGFFGLTMLVPWLADIRPPGTSLLAAVLILAAMLVPTVAVFSVAALRAVPDSSRNAAAGLGLSAATTFRCVTVRQAAGGIVAASLLALCRGLGETLAVLMVAGNLPQFPGSPLDAVRTVTGNLALELGYSAGPHRSALFASALLLTLLVASVLLLARLLYPVGGFGRARLRSAAAKGQAQGPDTAEPIAIGRLA